MKDLIQKIESYNWVDELGHPLVNCAEWQDLKDRIKYLSFKEVKMKPSYKSYECEHGKSRGE